MIVSILRQRLIYITSTLFFGVLTCFGQTEIVVDTVMVDSLQVEAEEAPLIIAGYDESQIDTDTVVYPFFSSGAILFDYGKLIGLALDTESKYEIGTQIDFKNKIIVVGEFGIATLEPNGAYQNASYSSEGYYYRFGLGYKYDMNPKNNFVFTARYGRSKYSDNGEVNIQSASRLFDPLVEPFDRETSIATWYELVLSSETRMWKGLYLGFHIRLRILDKYDEQEPLDVYSIPGYGRTIDKTIPALNLYVKYAFERF
ncbi:MAG: hypothetical protein JXR07_11240 [Reichenbachiella sp.]